MMAVTLEEHPVEVLRHAEDLEREAEDLQARAKKLRAEGARLRARARRLMEQAEAPARKPAPPDPLLAAAGLAAEELVNFNLEELGAELEVRDNARLARIVHALKGMGLVTEIGTADGRRRYRTVDPVEARARDLVQGWEGEHTIGEFAEELGLSEAAALHYVADLRAKGILAGGDLQLRYVAPARTDRFNRRRRAPAPEVELAHSSSDVPERGQVVDFTGRDRLPNRGSTPNAYKKAQRRRSEGRKGKGAPKKS